MWSRYLKPIEFDVLFSLVTSPSRTTFSRDEVLGKEARRDPHFLHHKNIFVIFGDGYFVNNGAVDIPDFRLLPSITKETNPSRILDRFGCIDQGRIWGYKGIRRHHSLFRLNCYCRQI